MGVHFTEDQQRAIDTLDKSILVSAAAGSGKTAVLVERIIHIILEGKANVDEMLVVTFTNATAAEMKLKLTRAIRQHMKDVPESAPVMNRQLNRMYRSYISTFHSFALRVIREFFYKIDREPTFRICDETQSQLLQMEAMDELFEECFENDGYIEGGSFRDFLEHYSSDRNETALMNEMMDTYAKLRSLPNYFRWAFEKAEMLRFPESGSMADSPVYQMLLERGKTELDAALKDCEKLIDVLDRNGIASLVAIANKDYEQLEELRDSLEHADGPDASAWGAVKFATFRVKKEEKNEYADIKEYCTDLRDRYKKRIKDFKNKFMDPSPETRFREMDAAYEYTVYYLKLLQEFEKRFDAKKQASDLVDFSDIEHITVRILEDPEVSDTLRKRFRFIFIDEYQDTNKLQEYLISKIARPDNLFKVGDVKQSIYGFRQSDPKIFMDTRREYEKEENTDSMVIDLNKNFRSNGATIQYINDVFEGIMPGYDDNAKLYQGLKGDDRFNLKSEAHILLEEDNGAADEPVEVDDDGEPIPKLEAEAAYIAKLVNGIIGTTFYDGKQGVRRVATPRDIVILCRSTSRSADVFYKAMLEQDIPAHVNDDQGYFDTVEIHQAMALLKLLDNGHQDVPLIGILRSEIFGFSPEELAKVRIAYKENGQRGAYYKAFEYCLKNPEALADDALYEKLRQAEEKLEEWRYLSNKMPLDEYIWYVLTESGYYLYAGAMYGGRQRQANLRILAEKARGYQENGVASLNGFIRYVDILRKQNVKTGQAAMISEDADVVRIMTIHKSKGLEFPFVIVAGMGKQMRGDNLGKGFMFDSDMGVSLSYVNRKDKFWRATLLQNLIMEKKRDEGFQEELRVLYVALTRAREKLILVGTAKSPEKLERGLPGKSSYYEIIKEKLFIPSVEYRFAPFPKQLLTRKRNLFEEFQNERDRFQGDAKAEQAAELVAQRLDYEYPDARGLSTKAKYTVSEIRTLREDSFRKRRIDLEEPEFQKSGKITGAEIGTGYHRIMERLDFRKAFADGVVDEEYIRQVGESLRDKGAISPEIFEALDLNMIKKFFATDIGRRASEAAGRNRLWKEKPFTLRTEVEDQSVLVQGVIDCYFREGDHIILVDYKSNRGSEEESKMKEMYQEQIRLYRIALEQAAGLPVTEAYLYMLRAGKTIEL